MKLFQSINWIIVLFIIILVTIGCIILVSIDAFEFPLFPIYIIVGFIGLLFFSIIDYRFYKNFYWVFYLLTLGFLFINILFSSSVRGANRWIDLGLFSLQTSEIAKPLLILSAAGIANFLNLEKIKNTFLYFIIWVPILFLLYRQPDLGNTIIYSLVILNIFIRARGNLIILSILLLISLISFPFLYNFLQQYQRDRITSFINPTNDPLGTGYNIIQAVITVGSGTFFGKGLGHGTQSRLQFLPERETDFIYATIAEEFGFIGSLLVLVLFFCLCAFIINIAKSSKDNFAKDILFGVFSVIFFQVIINIGMNTGLLPITGVTLPLISAGGSSFISIMIMFGIVCNISATKKSLF